MPYYEFEKNDVFSNTIELNPDCNFFIYLTKAYYKNLDQVLGNSNTPSGHINLYELNVNRPTNNLIYPFLPKGSSLEMFRTVTTAQYSALDSGALMSGSYPLTASIQTEVYDTSATRTQIDALKNILNYYNHKSPHYAFSSSLGNKASQRLTLIDFPSIFYGSKIKPGTVDLRFYLSGSLLGQLTDKNRNGELLQASGSISANDDKVAGVVLYNEGLIILTGSWDLNTTHTAKYVTDGGAVQRPRWNAFGRKTSETVSSSYGINIRGTQQTNVITMFAHAIPGDLNYSPNPTYSSYSGSTSSETKFLTSSANYREFNNLKLVNTISSSHASYNEKFKKQTFISKIAVYDENKNLIAIAKLAQPVRKQENDNYTFKLKLDY
tara:strand:- start:618 stop:1757 length:1140 start_codon:yes stop_codon:yes gene_type:complete